MLNDLLIGSGTDRGLSQPIYECPRIKASRLCVVVASRFVCRSYGWGKKDTCSLVDFNVASKVTCTCFQTIESSVG